MPRGKGKALWFTKTEFLAELNSTEAKFILMYLHFRDSHEPTHLCQVICDKSLLLLCPPV